MTLRELLKPKRRAAAVPLVLVAVIILLAMGAALLSLGVTGRIYSVRNAEKVKARSAADSGLAKALAELNQRLRTDPAVIEAVLEQTLPPDQASLPSATDEVLLYCGATYSYKVIPTDVWSALGTKGLTIESVGKCRIATARVFAFVRLKGLFDNAILVQNNISLLPKTLVTAYNSADPTDTQFDLQIGTASTSPDSVVLGPGTVVDGDVFVGVDGDPDTVIGTGGTINGAKYPSGEEPDFPAIVPPSLTDWATALSATGQTITLGPGQSGEYTAISLFQEGGIPSMLEIQGGEVVLRITGDITIGKDCEIVVRPGSSLVLYVDGNIAADNSVGFNNQAGNVRDFQLYATGTGEQVFSIKAKSSVFGTVYAPNVDITMYPGAEMYGAIVGKTVTFQSGSTFYYDEALRDIVSVYDHSVRFVIKRWREE